MLGLWARAGGVRVHFDSLEHLLAELRRGLDVSRFARLHPAVLEYYMLEHQVWGVTPVLSTPDSDTLHASFSYFVDDSEHARGTARAHAEFTGDE